MAYRYNHDCGKTWRLCEALPTGLISILVHQVMRSSWRSVMLYRSNSYNGIFVYGHGENFYYNIFINYLRISYMHAVYLDPIHPHSSQVHWPISSAIPNFISTFFFCNVVIVTHMHIGVRLSPGMWSTYLGPYPQWKLTFLPHKAIDANSSSVKGGSSCVPPSFIDFFFPSSLELIHFFPMLASGLLLLIYIPGPHCSFKCFPT